VIDNVGKSARDLNNIPSMGALKSKKTSLSRGFAVIDQGLEIFLPGTIVPKERSPP